MLLRRLLPVLTFTLLIFSLFKPVFAAEDPFKCEEQAADNSSASGGSTSAIAVPQESIGTSVQPYQQSVCQYKNALQEEDVNLQKFNLGLMDNLSYGLSRQIMGVPATDEELEKAQGGAPITSRPGAVPFLLSSIQTLYIEKPASGVQYLADLKSKVTGETYASTSGYDALKPTQALWTTFRNLTLLLYVLFFIVIGFMIIFRSRIGSGGVASIQAVLPKIIVSLILVSFSYAIVGLMIDLMNFFIAVMIQILSGNNVALEGSNGVYYRENVFSIMLRDLFAGNFTNIFGNTDDIIKGAIGNFGLPDLIEKFSSKILAAMAMAVIGIMMLIATFRIFFMLLMAYIKVFFYTIFGPIMIGIGVIPGMPGFGPWIRNIAAQLSTFVITILMIIFAAYFMGVGQDKYTSGQAEITSGGDGWNAPLLGGFDDEDNAKALKALIGIGILLGVPSAAKIAQEAFKVKGGGMGGMIGGAAAGIAGAGYGAAAYPFRGAAGRARTRVTDYGSERLNNTFNPWSADRQYDRLSRQTGAATPINPGTPGPAGPTAAPNPGRANPFRRNRT